MRTSNDYFGQGANCAQSVLVPWGSKLGLKQKDLWALSAGFGGGMGGQQKTCGAITGAYMVIGAYVYTHESGDIPTLKARVKELVQEFTRRFVEVFGATECRELLQCDFTQEDDHRRFLEVLRLENCPRYVDTASAILREMFA